MPPGDTPIEAFTSSAPYYEALFDAQARLKREGPYLKQVYEDAPGPAVVDLACGTGLHAKFFAELGANVTALDLSPDMIAHAQQVRPHPNIDYRQSDMTQLKGGPYDLALCLGNSLCLLPTHDAVQTTFQHIHDTLNPGGLFLLQILNYQHPNAQEPSHRVIRKTTGPTQITAIKNLVPNGDHTLLSLSFYAKTQGTYTSVSETAILQHLTLENLTALAQTARLQIQTTHGAYDTTPHTPQSSPDLILLLKRS